MYLRDGDLSLLANSARSLVPLGTSDGHIIDRDHSGSMNNIFRNSRGATPVEFALAVMPVLMFILGIMQTAWIVWADNLLQVSVDTAARCGAINSTTSPCAGSGYANMVYTAHQVFQPLSGATFVDATSAPACTSGTGLIGTYTINIVFVVNMTVTARSCYPVIS
jgi:Flp pilus assembly protein TadG